MVSIILGCLDTQYWLPASFVCTLWWRIIKSFPQISQQTSPQTRNSAALTNPSIRRWFRSVRRQHKWRFNSNINGGSLTELLMRFEQFKIAKAAAKDNHIHILEWLHQHGVLPYSSFYMMKLLTCCKYCDKKTFKWVTIRIAKTFTGNLTAAYVNMMKVCFCMMVAGDNINLLRATFPKLKHYNATFNLVLVAIINKAPHCLHWLTIEQELPLTDEHHGYMFIHYGENDGEYMQSST